MNELFVHWSRGWGVLSFSERLVFVAGEEETTGPEVQADKDASEDDGGNEQDVLPDARRRALLYSDNGWQVWVLRVYY